MRSARALVSLCLLGAALAGCHKEGGFAYSNDQFTYVSDEWRPWTVTLIDSRTGESLWSIDVPVGQQLAVGFREGSGPNEFKPDMMDWGLMPAGRWFGARNNTLPVPPSHARRLEPVLRPTPELAGTPLPGSPYSLRNDNSRVDAADAGKIKAQTADPMAAPKPRPVKRSTVDAPMMEKDPPAEIAPAPAPAESAPPQTPPAEAAPPPADPPVDVPDSSSDR